MQAQHLMGNSGSGHLYTVLYIGPWEETIPKANKTGEDEARKYLFGKGETFLLTDTYYTCTPGPLNIRSDKRGFPVGVIYYPYIASYDVMMAKPSTLQPLISHQMVLKSPISLLFVLN
jgi:hypothetical protein